MKAGREQVELSKKRKYKDEKFGQGGIKRYKKTNTSESSSDMASYPGRRNSKFPGKKGKFDGKKGKFDGKSSKFDGKKSKFPGKSSKFDGNKSGPKMGAKKITTKKRLGKSKRQQSKR